MAQGKQVAVHLAPPCSTFSRARDRSKRTRLRSSTLPRGLDPQEDRTRIGNEIADRAFELAHWAADELGALVTLENPQSSYIWAACGAGGDGFVDIVYSPCRFGA